MVLSLIVDAFINWIFYEPFSVKKRLLTVPITIVDHTEDGSWEFFSGNYLTKIRIIFLEEAIDYDSSVKEVEDLPLGFSAKRETTDSKWIRFKKSEK